MEVRGSLSVVLLGVRTCQIGFFFMLVELNYKKKKGEKGEKGKKKRRKREGKGEGKGEKKEGKKQEL